MPPNLWQVRRCRRRSRFICSIVSVSGVDFRCREGDFSPFSAVCSSVYSCSISCVSVRSCACVELLKTARMDNISVACLISSISIAPPFSPLFDKCGGASFLCLPSCRFAVGAGRSSLPLIGLRRLIISSVSLLLPSGRFVLPVLCLGSLVLAPVSSSCRSRCLIISSSFAPVSRYGGAAAAMRCWRADGRAGVGGLLSCLGVWCDAVLPTRRRPLTASPHPDVMFFSLSSFPFRPTPSRRLFLTCGP